MQHDAASATWTDAAAAGRARRPAVLPFGALEQHGPHLPLSTDTLLAAELARRVADAIGAWLLPAVPYGDTTSNDGFPGTASLSFDTVRAIAVDLCRGLRRTGFSCLIVVNGDHGNQAPLRLAARDAAGAADGLPVLVVDYPGLAEAAAEVCETTAAAPGFYHADEVETSIVLALRPDLVCREEMADAYPATPAFLGSTPIGLHELSPTGVFGDPRPATAEKGERLLSLLADRSVALCRAFLEERVGGRLPVTPR